MKPTRIVLSVAACVMVAFTSQAQTNVSIFDWKFSTAANPSSPIIVTNPFGATASATFLGSFNTYVGGAGPGGQFGTPTGLWDIVNGKLELGISLGAVSVVEFTLKLTQFVDSGAFYPGILSFTSPNVPGFTSANALPPTRTVIEQQTGNMIGFWVLDEYKWNPMGAPGPIKLDVAPGTSGTGEVLFDEVELTVKGDLTSAPEPGALQLVALGFAALAMRSFSRKGLKG